MDGTRSSLRRDALAKIAALSITTTSSQQQNLDLHRLSQGLPPVKASGNGYLDGVFRALAPTSRVPMSLRELDLLLALCSTATKVKRSEDASRLASQLGGYLPEVHTQLFTQSPFLSAIRPTPWTTLTHQLTVALLDLGSRFADLESTISDSIRTYITNWTSSATALASQSQTAEDGEMESEAQDIAAMAVSMAGFLDATAEHESFWRPFDRIQLVQSIKDALSDTFLIAVEKATSALRHSSSTDQKTREWKKYLKRYAASGNPVGAMLLQKGFMRMLLSCCASLVNKDYDRSSHHLLDEYLRGAHLDELPNSDVSDDMIEYLADLIADQMRVLEDGSDYLQLSSSWLQRLAFSVKAYALEAFVHCMVVDEDVADAEIIFGWLEDTLSNNVQMADLQLAEVALKSTAISARYMPEAAPNIARVLLRFIVQGTSMPEAVAYASESLSYILRMLSQDAIITTLYSLGNILSSQSGAEKLHHTLSPSPDKGQNGSLGSTGRRRTASVISLSMSGDEETSVICGNVAHAIVMVATSCGDSKITALAQTMMLQKIGRIGIGVDARIVEESAKLAVHGKEAEFRALLRLHSRMHHEAVQQNNTVIFEAVRRARQYMALHLDNQSSLFRIYAYHLLERVLSKGDVVESEFKRSAEVEQAAKEIGPLLKPLSILAVRKAPADTTGSLAEDAELATMVRETWFNIAVHGITLQSPLGQQYYQELRLLAKHSQPLVDQDRLELLESDVELSTILRRGMSPEHTTEQKRTLTAIIPDKEGDVRGLTYQKTVFLNAVYLVESLRATSGQCADVLQYFADPTLKSSNMGHCLSAIAAGVVTRYVQKVVPGDDISFGAPAVSRQLVKLFSGCCHRSKKMQEVARAASNHIISAAPSALIQKAALFGLLELLSLIWSSCLDEDLDEYDWRSSLTSRRGKITVELSDNYPFRKATLNHLYSDARRWVDITLAIAPLDVKGLLQTYLSEFDDTGAYGHVSLGRSFALEMGSAIPPMDQRLAAIDQKGESVSVNVASDFIAQYTTRQEYRFAGIPEHGPENLRADIVGIRDGRSLSNRSITDITKDAELLLTKIRDGYQEVLAASEFKDVLRRAAAVLCTSKRSQTAIVHYLVTIPFEIFSKDSIKLGISLWLGVIHENPRMEPRILTEVAQAWERTIDRKVGIFSPDFDHPDPFYVKEEFAPSDKAALQRLTQQAQNTISPHLRVVQFFQSHFNAIRLGSSNTQRTFIRMMDRTLRGFMHIRGHPLLREIQFHVVLFALRLLKFSTCFTKLSLWSFKDRAISIGLHWFKMPPAWSFGGNRLQVKAEIQIMQGVQGLLQQTRQIGISTSSSRKDTPQKLQLLELLLESEITRLSVWLFPLKHEGHHSHSHAQSIGSGFARTAWAEDPSLAVQLLTRFPNESLHRDVRFLLLNFPDKAIHEANALDVLLGDKLPTDISFQIKYLLYWNPVNPIQAVTYFMPAYGNHPFILQYAMRALESHSVDVTFFYVPQIVQCLRYDALGYVARYIVETGSFSQLFAHQIIWNIKANAYKDDEATIEDAIKPTLDQVMESLISSFNGEDKAFYEREFAFFGEVTDISGKLKPFIKKTKPEKKQKIEEELRKIKVEVGVYLPSNPDGVVVGIDRKSGKPLQSHAKAPYMATFRIRKQRQILPGETRHIESPIREKGERPGHERSSSTMSAATIQDPNAPAYEIWQSAIFKVGDDCRQDILALQMIAAFRGIFNSVGLDVYVYPYRVTATAPGCGVIDVLPNSISRDMLGREAVNGLYDYFVTKYGGEHSIRFQEARSEFVKSMAAYSVISYLMQFKDRHNGNIMVDDKGHILHIDFGFCFDISPGGVRFERAPFKLTEEMMAVLGGDESAQSYRWFEELTIKAFLCSRQYCNKLCDLVSLMLDSGLPCFKPETMKNFRDRFVLEKSEREAAQFMLGCIKKSEGNVSTKVYDEFQLLTNGIPY